MKRETNTSGCEDNGNFVKAPTQDLYLSFTNPTYFLQNPFLQ
ncbi:hypothetical protein SB48_HM08orf00204 [Heyndrickxia coagulans]|uniref:Uncharacterized protein n=1 Tax=Heyndrickxia coagulans TaxID=1398 RepID=A0AAN0T1S6_HEYCO|nr:hypothetical protein SB48_HM08orf00204 [Heyndrickxia coagulans]